ncbi:MAG: putative efflux rane fusion protein [Gammaproteobacteria bacterium]|nr:putative efflux rane fusion protein [Gammaproteobacteria bacterium]
MVLKPVRTVAAIALVLVLTFAVWKLGKVYGHSGTPGSPAAASVRVAVVRRAAISTSVTNIGTVQALNTVLVRARVDGAIEQVLFKEGQIVSRGDVLVKLDPLPFEAQLRVNQAQLAKDSALLDNARVDLQRYEDLLQADSTSKQTRDTARSLVAQLAAAVANDAAQVDLARLSLSYATIKAPIAGRVGGRLIDAGNIVHTADAAGLVVITQLSPIAVSFAIPQERLGELRAAQVRGPIPVTVLNEAGGPSENQGEVILIDNQIDATTGTIRCKAQFSNATDTLWPGQFVTVRIALKTLPDAILIPTIAVQNGSEGSYVYVVTASNRVQARVVHIGSVEGDQAIVVSGLSPGETVVTEGQFRLEPDAPVHIASVDPPRTALP